MAAAWLTSPRNWPRKSVQAVHSAVSLIVFFFLDFLDAILCIFFRFVDEFFEGKATPCYCKNRGTGEGSENWVSETLYGRKNVFRELGFLGFPNKFDDLEKTEDGSLLVKNRWSDCGCESCVLWMNNVEKRLHVAVKEPSKGDHQGKPPENVIFFHGFMSSSLFWTETLFPHLSEMKKHNYKMFAVDLLGFGRSPKPKDCLYTLKDHLEMIEKSVIHPNQLESFHVVAHSMGCVIALGLAAKYSNSVRSVTLFAPPYFPYKDGASLIALRRLADRKLWPPLLFGSAFMSWYEHLGRCVCFFICRNHRTWEQILKLLTRRRDLSFLITDMTKHTHHSAWHSIHNVLCGGAKFMDGYLEALKHSGTNIHVIQGSEDNMIPLECISSLKMKVPHAEVNIIANADHTSVILGREKELARRLECIWKSDADMCL